MKLLPIQGVFLPCTSIGSRSTILLTQDLWIKALLTRNTFFLPKVLPNLVVTNSYPPVRSVLYYNSYQIKRMLPLRHLKPTKGHLIEVLLMLRDGWHKTLRGKCYTSTFIANPLQMPMISQFCSIWKGKEYTITPKQTWLFCHWWLSEWGPNKR